MTTLSNILQHYGKSEEKFVRKVYNDLEDVKYNFVEKRLGFLDPNEIAIVKQLSSMLGVNLSADGYYENAELKYVIAYNKDSGYIPELFLAAVELKYNRKFNKLEHAQIMGTLYNSSIDTNMIGDIIVNDEGRVQIVVSYDIVDILRLNIDRYANVKVNYDVIDCISISNKQRENKIYSSKSLRLDSICKMLSKVSRTKISKNISKGEVRVNFKVIVDNKFEIKEKDLVSIRGYGRYEIIKITKVNNKYNIVYKK